MFLSFGFTGQIGDGFFAVASQVPDSDSVFGGGGDPLEFRVELNLVDGGSSFDGSDGFSEVGDVPDVQLLVSSSSGKIFGVRGDGYGVDRSFMGFEGCSDLEVGVPNLESSVPTGGGEVWVEDSFGLGLKEGTVSNAGNPFSVVVNFTGEFAVG